MATDFDDLVAGLRLRAGQQDAHQRAAVELICWHEFWLRRPDFLEACVQAYGGVPAILWSRAREFTESGPACSTSQLNVLRVAAAIGSNEFGLTGFGHIHRYKVAEAFAGALGQTLEGLIPEAGHNHPDFIPGTPETCEACAREARDEGRT
jgi:hypothetical protein